MKKKLQGGELEQCNSSSVFCISCVYEKQNYQDSAISSL